MLFSSLQFFLDVSHCNDCRILFQEILEFCSLVHLPLSFVVCDVSLSCSFSSIVQSPAFVDLSPSFNNASEGTSLMVEKQRIYPPASISLVYIFRQRAKVVSMSTFGCTYQVTFTSPSTTHVQAATSNEKSVYTCIDARFRFQRLKLLHSCAATQISNTVFGLCVQRFLQRI